jgi:hypothetical protein
MTQLMDQQTGTCTVDLCYYEIVVLCDQRLSNFGYFNVNRKSGEECTRVITLRSSTPCGEVNNTSILINVKYNEPFWV